MIEEVFRKYDRHVEFIGEHLVDVSQVGAYGSQLIHLASFANHCDDIRELLMAGAKADAVGDLGLRPLHYAVLGGSVDAVRLLLGSGADASLENEYRETPAQMAHVLGLTDIVGLFAEVTGNSTFGFDGGSTARERWLEFKSIQQSNFSIDEV